MSAWKRFKAWLKGPQHDRVLIVLSNGLCVVKCRKCGAESIPWQAPRQVFKEGWENHKDDWKIAHEIDKRIAATGDHGDCFGRE